MVLSAGELNIANDNLEQVMKNGASEGIRTLDTHVGNVMLYQAELRSHTQAIKLEGSGRIASEL